MSQTQWSQETFLKEEKVGKALKQKIRNNVRTAIYNYFCESSILARLKELTIQLNAVMKIFDNQRLELMKNEVEILTKQDDIACLDIIKYWKNVEEEINLLLDKLARTKRLHISYLTRIYNMTPACGLAIRLPVNICGFITTVDEMCEVFLSFFKQKILLENKQFLIYYASHQVNVLEAIHGINFLNNNQRPCELFMFGQKYENNPKIQEFISGTLRGVCLPIDRYHKPEFLKKLMQNVGYVINFYLVPPKLDSQKNCYWDRIKSSKFIKSSHPITVVDFLTTDSQDFYETMYMRKGFLLSAKSYPNFYRNRKKSVTYSKLHTDSCLPASHIKTNSHFQLIRQSKCSKDKKGLELTVSPIETEAVVVQNVSSDSLTTRNELSIPVFNHQLPSPTTQEVDISREEYFQLIVEKFSNHGYNTFNQMKECTTSELFETSHLELENNPLGLSPTTSSQNPKVNIQINERSETNVDTHPSKDKTKPNSEVVAKRSYSKTFGSEKVLESSSKLARSGGVKYERKTFRI